MPNEKHMLCCEIKFFNFHYNKFLKSHIVETKLWMFHENFSSQILMIFGENVFTSR